MSRGQSLIIGVAPASLSICDVTQ